MELWPLTQVGEGPQLQGHLEKKSLSETSKGQGLHGQVN